MLLTKLSDNIQYFPAQYWIERRGHFIKKHYFGESPMLWRSRHAVAGHLKVELSNVELSRLTLPYPKEGEPVRFTSSLLLVWGLTGFLETTPGHRLLVWKVGWADARSGRCYLATAQSGRTWRLGRLNSGQ